MSSILERIVAGKPREIAAAKERDATPYDIPDVHFSHEG